MELQELIENAKELRQDIVKVCYDSSDGHVGGSLSAIDILNTLYFSQLNNHPDNQDNPERDRFVLSKGHIAEALYVVLAKKGYFDRSKLDNFSCLNSKLFGHPCNEVPGIDLNTGSLGHGLPLAVGLALGAKKQNRSYRTYVLMGDGELAEGSVWEGAMAASHYKLDNLCAIVDRNQLQISGPTETVMSLGDLNEKWRSFGFEVIEIDGNDYEQLLLAFDKVKTIKDRPTLILADTIKGKGVTFMENEASWHHGLLNEMQYEQAIKELGGE